MSFKNSPKYLSKSGQFHWRILPNIGRQINICNYTTQSLSEKRSGNICLSFQEARITDTRNKTKTAHTQKRKLQTSVLYKYSCKNPSQDNSK